MLRETPLFLLVGTCALSASCGQSSSPYLDHSQFEPVSLQGEIFHVSPVVGRPAQLGSSGQRLWIADAARDPDLHMLDRASGDLLHSIGRKGQGPGDLASPAQIHVVPGDSSGAIWAWDRGLRRLTRFDGQEPSLDPITVTVEFPAGVPGPYRVAWLEPDLLVGIHPSEEARFSLFTASGQHVKTVPGTFLGPEQVRLSLRRNVTIGSFNACSWPGRGFAIIYFLVGRIEFYDRDAQLVRLAHVPFPSEAFVEEDGEFVPARGREYYRDCVVHDDRLYAAFSGRRESAYEAPDSYAAEFVHLFDWAGALRRVYRLEPAVHNMEISAEGGALYGASLSDATIYRFTLPDDVETNIAQFE